jgi:endonuclease-3
MPSAEFAQLVLRRLSERYGAEIRTQLEHRNMTHLFVAVLLSPQCTDKQVNKTTRVLFKKFRTFDDYASADLKSLRYYLRGLNYYKTKAKHLKEAAKQIVTQFHGKVPRKIDELLEIQGVGRKVANVVLNEGYGIDEGIAVDTHSTMVARRLKLSRYKDPYKIEKELTNIYPANDWGRVSNSFIELGRDTCKARNRECFRCVLKDICPSSDVKPIKN